MNLRKASVLIVLVTIKRALDSSSSTHHQYLDVQNIPSSSDTSWSAVIVKCLHPTVFSVYLLEKPVDLGSANVQGSNVVKDSWRNIDPVRAAARAQVNNLCGGLAAISLDGDPFPAVGTVGIVCRVERHHWRAVVVSPTAGTEALYL